MSKTNPILFYLCLFLVVLLNGCRTIPPPAEVKTEKISNTSPTKASDLLVIISVNLEVSKSFTFRKIRKSYTDFALHLESELIKHGIKAKVITSSERNLTIDPEKQHEHVGVLALQSMYTSSGHGDSSRVWLLSTLQRDNSTEKKLMSLYTTSFVSDFEGCYVIQATVADNKAECRAKIVEFIIEHFKQSGILN